MNRMRLAGVLGLAAFAACGGALGGDKPDAQIERGRYLVAVSGCNDCHTPGYPESGGSLPESDWLVGSSVGFQGPWGTTYPANLRRLLASSSESEWLELARTAMRPPMPWFSLHRMTDGDLRAIYAFVRELGPAGEPAPRYVPPGQTVLTPIIEFTPKLAEERLQASR